MTDSAAQALEVLGNITVAAQNEKIAALEKRVRDLEADRTVRFTIYRVPRDPELDGFQFDLKQAVAEGHADGTEILLEEGNLPDDLPEPLSDITRLWTNGLWDNEKEARLGNIGNFVYNVDRWTEEDESNPLFIRIETQGCMYWNQVSTWGDEGPWYCLLVHDEPDHAVKFPSHPGRQFKASSLMMKKRPDGVNRWDFEYLFFKSHDDEDA